MMRRTVNGHAGKGVQARGCRQGGAGKGVQAGGCRQGDAGKGDRASKRKGQAKECKPSGMQGVQAQIELKIQRRRKSKVNLYQPNGAQHRAVGQTTHS